MMHSSFQTMYVHCESWLMSTVLSLSSHERKTPRTATLPPENPNRSKSALTSSPDTHLQTPAQLLMINVNIKYIYLYMNHNSFIHSPVSFGEHSKCFHLLRPVVCFIIIIYSIITLYSATTTSAHIPRPRTHARTLACLNKREQREKQRGNRFPNSSRFFITFNSLCSTSKMAKGHPIHQTTPFIKNKRP